MRIPGQSSDWHTTGLPRDVISLVGVVGGVLKNKENWTVLAKKLSAVFLSLWGVCLWCTVSADGALCGKGDKDTRV